MRTKIEDPNYEALTVVSGDRELTGVMGFQEALYKIDTCSIVESSEVGSGKDAISSYLVLRFSVNVKSEVLDLIKEYNLDFEV